MPPKYEVIYLVDNKYKNYTYYDIKSSAYNFAVVNKPSKVLMHGKTIKVFK